LSARPRFCVLISGEGRNLQALIDACTDGRIDADIVAVVSNRASAPGLVRAAAAGIDTFVVPHTDFATREAFDAALADTLAGIAPDYVLLAGFMRILGADLINRYAGRMLNVHPSLLPKYRGLHTHRRALAAGDTEHGASVHFVTPELDGGPVAVQGQFTIRAEDDESTLADRVMHEIERRIYPQTAAWLAAGDLALEGSAIRFRGRLRSSPLGFDDFDESFLEQSP
jgi:phosphoribosylglycinamide formyltransferase-1